MALKWELLDGSIDKPELERARINRPDSRSRDGHGWLYRAQTWRLYYDNGPRSYCTSVSLVFVPDDHKEV